MDLRSSAKRYLPAQVTDAVRTAKYTLERWTFLPYVATHRYGSHVLRMNIHDRVAKEWYDRDWDLPPEIAFLSQHGLAPGARVFDLGAHQCLIAMLLAKRVAPQGQVMAVEANLHNVEVARRNIAANAVANVDVIHGLVSGDAGRATAAASFNSYAVAEDHGRVGINPVDSLTIDELSRRAGWPDIVYMDIEGFEIEALKGAAETLARSCPWFVELHGDAALSRYQARNQDILSYFPPRRFARFVCAADGGSFQPLIDDAVPTERCFMVFVPQQAAKPPRRRASWI